MHSFNRPIGLLVTTLFLGLAFTNTVLAFECTNAGAGSTAPDDGGAAGDTACGEGAIATGQGTSTAVGGFAWATALTSTALGHSAKASAEGSTALGRIAEASGTGSTAVGSSATASGFRSTALGGSAIASTRSTALGRAAMASMEGSTALGDSATASGIASVALGWEATASGTSSTVLGRQAQANGANTTAVGFGATTNGHWSSAFGTSARVFSPFSNATALGNRAEVEQSNAMVLGSIPGVNSGTDYVDVGIGTTMPGAPLHIFRDDETLEFMFLESDTEGAAQDRAMMQLSNNGGIRFQFDNTATGNAWRFQAGTGNEDNFEITKVGTGVLEMRLDGTGNLTIQGTLTQNSDVNAKRDIEATDGHLILAKLDTLPVAEWTYKRDTSGARHLGPMAQDFHAAFGLGEDETKIAPGDMAGVNMAAIKALRKELQDKDAELAELKNRLARLEALMLKNSLNMSTAGL